MDITYNLPEIKKALSDFYTLTGCRIALFDRNFREILASPTRLSSMCKFLRENNQLLCKCKEDDYRHIKLSKNSKTAILYTCHAGFFEMVCPLIIGDESIGFFVVGQIHGQNSETPTFELFHEKLSGYDIDKSRLCEEFSNLQLVPHNKILAVKNLTEIYAKHICDSKFITIDDDIIDKDTLTYKIDSFILQNITRELSVQDFCKEFNYNKTNFYKVTNKLYDVPIMQHIKRLRIHKAKLLLSSSPYKINEIAEMIGIYDFNYFTKIFKNEVGCTPREFRKNNISTNDGEIF